MSKKIIIPVGKICSAIVLAEGICGSIITEKALTTVLGKDTAVKRIGTNAAALAVSIPFTEEAAKLWSNESMTIKIPIGKKKKEKEKDTHSLSDIPVHGNMKKNIKNIRKAIKLWSMILTSAILTEYRKCNIDEHSSDIDTFINIEEIKEFNKVMKKLSINFEKEYIPITIPSECSEGYDEDISDEIFDKSDKITEIIKYYFKFTDGYDIIATRDMLDIEYTIEQFEMMGKLLEPKMCDIFIQSLIDANIDVDKIEKSIFVDTANKVKDFEISIEEGIEIIKDSIDPWNLPKEPEEHKEEQIKTKIS